MNERLLPTGDLQDLSIAERLDLLEAVWASLDGLPEEAVPAPDWHKAEIEARLEALDAGTSVGTPWSDVRKRILRQP